jgi:hypothetical protein
MWALALERLPADAVDRLVELARLAGGEQVVEAEAVTALAEARRLYEQADVFMRAATIVEEERRLATAAVAGCRLGRLREVLEFLLDLAVPEQAALQFAARS